MKRAARIAGLTIVMLAGLLVAAELAFRVVVGERLLLRGDADIEYLPQPNQSVRQRGLLFETNEWGMRSPPVLREKPEGVFRVLVLGDSVVFGHSNIDQADLATTLLGALVLDDGRKIEALNASAPSWGPGNLLAWVEANGLFAADAAVIVMSGHDIDDDRTFSSAGPDAYPKARPISALGEWVVRKLRRDTNNTGSPDPRSAGDARRALPELFARMAGTPGGGCLVVHATTDEHRSDAPSRQAAELAEIAASQGLSVVHDREFVESPGGYVDGVHLSEKGQAGLVAAMQACAALAKSIGG